MEEFDQVFYVPMDKRTFYIWKSLTKCQHVPRMRVHYIIIIIDFYGAYILRNLSSEAQQNRISKRNRKQGRAKVSIRTRDNRTFMVGMQFGIDVLSFFRKIAIVSDVFKVIVSSFRTLGAATEKARLPKLSFVLGTISCCEVDDLSCLGIFERCRRLAK